jgi:signal peptidase I
MPERKKINRRKVLLYTFSIVFLFALFLRSFLFEIYKVEKNSMNNSFFDGDRVLINKFGRKNISRNDVVVFRSSRDVYIKRCIGLPGEILEIRNGKTFINGREIKFPAKAVLPDTAAKFKADHEQVSNVMMLDIYGKYWDMNNFGPYLIPKKGMTIELTAENLKLYKTSLESAGELGTPIDNNNQGLIHHHYTFQHDYYFVLGDNRPRSDDSRIFGAINETRIIGKTCFTF